MLRIDYILFNALRMYRDGLCKGCGQPAYWAWDIRSSVYYTLDPNGPSCVVCELLEGDEDKPEPGDKRRVINLRFETED